jgi:hypothetical protein
MKRKLDVQSLPESSSSPSPLSSRASSRSDVPAKMSDTFFYKPYEPSAAPQSSSVATNSAEKKVGITPARPLVGALLGGFKKK